MKFKDYKYVGDPINAVKIFNEKEVDELAILDIDASRENREPNFSKISEIISEAFMPVAYGGGITNIDQIREILLRGVEKVVLNKVLHSNPQIVTDAADRFGAQSIVASIDVRKTTFGGHKVYTENGKINTGLKPEAFALEMQRLGAGEVLLNSIDRDGTYGGYDVDLLSKVANSLTIPVIALGGAGTLDDFRKAQMNGASAVAAGSMFVFKRPHQAVLISYPKQSDLDINLFNRIE